MGGLPRRQRVAAYAVILREGCILLSRLAPRISSEELWTLPGGGLDHGEDPRDAVVREVAEETGLVAEVGETARVYSAHVPHAWRDGVRVDAHALRIVYEGWVAADAPEPRVVEVGGSTVEARWVPVRDVLARTVPVVPMVAEALRDHAPPRVQRLAAYAVVRRGPGDRPHDAASEGAGSEVLLTRCSALGPRPGTWTLPGGGVAHGEEPAATVARELAEECGLDARVGELLDLHAEHFEGTAPSGRHEDFHSLHLLFAATVDDAAEPRVVEEGGTTDAAAWVPVADVVDEVVAVTPVVRHVLGLARDAHDGG